MYNNLKKKLHKLAYEKPKYENGINHLEPGKDEYVDVFSCCLIMVPSVTLK